MEGDILYHIKYYRGKIQRRHGLLSYPSMNFYLNEFVSSRACLGLTFHKFYQLAIL